MNSILNTDSFQLFGLMHLTTIGIILLIAFILVVIARSAKCQNWIKPISWILAVVLLTNEIIFVTIVIRAGIWSYKWGLPLNICDLAIFAVAYSLIRHNQFVWEVAYFWGLGGTMQAILTPDIYATFPDYMFFKFFITHGCIVIGVIFLAAGRRRLINLKSVKRIWITTNIYGIFILIFNGIFDTNYLYLCAKPSRSSVIDFLGPWPYYIFGLEIILIISLFLYYLPYHVVRQVDSCTRDC